jgi:hypothetical protein
MYTILVIFSIISPIIIIGSFTNFSFIQHESFQIIRLSDFYNIVTLSDVKYYFIILEILICIMSTTIILYVFKASSFWYKKILAIVYGGVVYCSAFFGLGKEFFSSHLTIEFLVSMLYLCFSISYYIVLSYKVLREAKNDNNK